MVKYTDEASSIIKHAGNYAKTTLKHSTVQMVHILWAIYYHQPVPAILEWLQDEGVNEDMMRAEFAKPNFWNGVDDNSDSDSDSGDKINLSPEFQKFMEMTSLMSAYGIVDTSDIVKAMLTQGETKASLLLAKCSGDRVQPVDVGIPTVSSINASAVQGSSKKPSVVFDDSQNQVVVPKGSTDKDENFNDNPRASAMKSALKSSFRGVNFAAPSTETEILVEPSAEVESTKRFRQASIVGGSEKPRGPPGGGLGAKQKSFFPQRMVDMARGTSFHVRAEKFLDNNARYKELDKTGAVVVSKSDVAPLARKNTVFFGETKHKLQVFEAGNASLAKTSDQVGFLGGAWRSVLKTIIIKSSDKVNGLMYTRNMQLFLPFMTGYEAYILAGLVEAYDLQDSILIEKMLTIAFRNRNVSRVLVQQMARFDIFWHWGTQIAHNRTFDKIGRIPIIGFGAFPGSENAIDTQTHARNSMLRVILGKGNWITRTVTGREGLQTDDKNAASQNLAAEVSGFEAANRNQFGTYFGRQKTDAFRYEHRLPTDESIVRTFITSPNPTMVNNGIEHTLRCIAKHWQNINYQPSGNFAHQRMEQINPFEIMRFHMPIVFMTLTVQRGLNKWDATVLAPFIRKLQLIEPAEDTTYIRTLMDECNDSIIDNVCGGIKLRVDAMRDWIQAIINSLKGFEETALEVSHIISSVEIGLRLGHDLISTVDWRVPSQKVMRAALITEIYGKECTGVERLVVQRSMGLLAPRDKRTMIELVKDGKEKSAPCEFLIRRTITLLQREIRRASVVAVMVSLSKGDHVSKFAKKENYWIEDEDGTARVYTYSGKKTGVKEHRFLDKLTGIERWIAPSDYIGIRTYIPVAECITRVQKAYMNIECDHGTKYTLNGLMEFSYLRKPLRNMIVLSQINCEELDDARLNILKDIQESDLTNISIRDLVPGRTYYTFEKNQFVPLLCDRVYDENDDDWDTLARKTIVTVPPQNMIVIGGGPTGLVTTIHNLENVLTTGGVMRLYEARDAFAKGGATFERAQIVRLDARWIAMMRYHLGTIFEDVYIPAAGETDSHQGNSLPTQGFVEITIKDLESMLHLEVCRLLSKKLLQHDTNAGANYDVKTNSLQKLGKSLKKDDLIFHNLDNNGNKSEDQMYSWKVSGLEYNVPLEVEDLKIGEEYSVYIPDKQENHEYQLVMVNLSTETIQFKDIEDDWEGIECTFDQLPSIYPKGTTQHSAVKKVMLECTLPSDTFSYAIDELDFSGIKTEKFTMDIQHTHVVEAVGKPVGSNVHFQVTTYEPYGVCCISGLKISLTMHNFGSKRFGDGIIDDIRSQTDQNTRIIGDFTKNVKTSLIAERMHEFFVRKEDANWRLHFEKFISLSGFDIGSESITTLLSSATKEYARIGKTCRRPFLQTRFFETGDFFYLGMEFTREYDTWKLKFADDIANRVERKLSSPMKPRDRGRFKGGIGHNIDRLWFDACLESIRFGDVYNPGARFRVPHLYLTDAYVPTQLSKLPVGEAFVVDDQVSAQNRYEILIKNGSDITCRTVEGIVKHFNGNKMIRRGGNLARGPDGISESKVALATFPVAHYVNYRTMRVNNVDNGYSFGFAGDEQSTPHFMRYSGLTGACINGYLFNKFVGKAIAGVNYIDRARDYMAETNWNNGEVVQRGTGANYGRDGFLRPGFSYAHGLDYLRSKVIEHKEFEQDFEQFLSRDWLIKFAASWIPKRLEMDDNFMDEIQANLKKAIKEQFVAEIARDSELWEKPHKVLLDKIFAEIESSSVGKISISLYWSQVIEKLGHTDERVIDFHVPIAQTLEQAVIDIMDFSRQYYTGNLRITSELENQPKSVDFISDDFAVQAQNFTASLTFSATLSSAALAVLLLDDSDNRIQGGTALPRIGSAILSGLTPFVAFGSITNASQYKNRNELSRELYRDQKYLPFLQEIFSFMTRGDQVAIPLNSNPFYFEINDLATKFVNDCLYYDQKASGNEFTQNKFEPTEFMNEFRTFAISPCDDASAVKFLASLQTKLIPVVFQENSYLQESLTNMTVVLKRVIEYNGRRYRTSAEASFAAKVLLERVHGFENRLNESLQRGSVRFGFFKRRRFRHGHLFTTIVQFGFDKLWRAHPRAIPQSQFAARSRASNRLRPITAETFEIMAQTESLISQLPLSDKGGLNRSVQDLTQFYHATKESYVSSLIVVSGILSFFTAIIFTIGNIGAAASDNTIQGFRTLVRIGTNSFGFVTPITALLAMFHLFRKFFVLRALSGKLGNKLSGGVGSEAASNIKTVRAVTRTQELSVLMRFIASAAAGVSLYWQWVNAEPLRDDDIADRRIPGWIGLGAFGLHILSIFFLIIIEYFIRYNFDPKLGEYLGESFRDEISAMYHSFSIPITNIDTKQEQNASTWEYVSREFVHEYRFDTVFAADRFSAIYHYLQSGLPHVNPEGKKDLVV